MFWDARTSEELSDLWTKRTDLLVACYFFYKNKDIKSWMEGGMKNSL